MMKPPPFRSRRLRLGLCLLLGAAGGAACGWLPDGAGDLGFGLGIMLGLVVGSFWGGRWAAGVAALALLPALAGGAGHPLGWGLATAGAGAVGWMVRRRGFGLLKAGSIFWLGLGAPVTLGFFGLFSTLPFPSNWDQGLSLVVVGWGSSLLADVITGLRWVRRGLSIDTVECRQPLSQHLFRRFSLLAVLPLLVVFLVAANRYAERTRAQAETLLSQSAAQVAGAVAEHLRVHAESLAAVARQYDGQPFAGPAEWDRRLEVIRGQKAGFLTLLVANENGDLAGRALGDLSPPAGAVRTNVADRDYFTEALRTGQPYVSGVFQGRGFGRDLIVAISVPGRDAAGRPWVLEGSLSLGDLMARIERSDAGRGRDLVLTDDDDHVVAATRELGLPVLSSFAGFPRLSAEATPDGGGDDHGVSARGVFAGRDRLPGRNRDEVFWVAQAAVDDVGWTVHLRERVWYAWRSVAVFYVFSVLVAGGATALVLSMASLTARRLTRSLRTIVEQARGLADGRGVRNAAISQAGMPLELGVIGQELQSGAQTLAATNRALGAAVERADEKNRQLERLSGELEAKVRQRTGELEEARRIAEQANRAKSEFLATMSHELRTPLHVILGMSEIMREAPPSDPLESRPYLDGIEESGRHLLELINDILDLSKVEAGKLELDLEPTQILPVCEAALRLVQPQSRRKQLAVESRIEFGEELVCTVDGRRLKQVLLNLLSNAVKFTAEGGRVELAARHDAERGELLLTVADNGEGIAPEDQARLFQPFVQARDGLAREAGGTGLGLALVKRMVELHGGTVDLSSEPGRGSTFTVRLPDRAVAPAPAPAVENVKPRDEELARAEAALRRRRPRILVVEDNPLNVTVLRNYLPEDLVEMHEAADGHAGVMRARELRPDLILMDICMPVMDGIDAALQLQGDEPLREVPIVFLTAQAMVEDRERCEAAGAFAHLTKPVKRRDLVLTLARALAESGSGGQRAA